MIAQRCYGKDNESIMRYRECHEIRGPTMTRETRSRKVHTTLRETSSTVNPQNIYGKCEIVH